MKSINNFLIAGFMLTAFACANNMNDALSSTDIAALQAMESSYAGAIDANNSLVTYVESTGVSNDQTAFALDDSFHEYDSMFEANHEMYSHNNNGDDHDSGSWSMGSGMTGGHGNGGMMGGDHSGGGFNSQNCSQSNLESMDSLMLAHEQYHPED